MSEIELSREKKNQIKNASKDRKPYLKPDFRYEKVFETLALSCGKVASSTATCQFSKKSS